MVSGRVIPGISLGPLKVNIGRYSPSDCPFTRSAATLANSPAASRLTTGARETPESSAMASYFRVSFLDSEKATPCQLGSSILAAVPRASPQPVAGLPALE